MPEDVHPKQARITGAEAEQLEREIDRMNEGLPPLRSFVLPGGSRLNAELHVCRTVCRRAERICVALAQQAGSRSHFEISEPAQRRAFRLEPLGQPSAGVPETLWEPNQAASSAGADHATIKERLMSKSINHDPLATR